MGLLFFLWLASVDSDVQKRMRAETARYLAICTGRRGYNNYKTVLHCNNYRAYKMASRFRCAVDTGGVMSAFAALLRRIW